MKIAIVLVACMVSQSQAANWPLDSVVETTIVRGSTKTADGVTDQSLVLDGESLIELDDSAHLSNSHFTISLWFNPYELNGGQQMLVGKNRYSRNEREWSLTIEPNGKLKAHLRQNDWRTIACDETLVAGKWHLVTLVVGDRKAKLFLNGKLVGEEKLKNAIAPTLSPITIGGIWDEAKVRQAFYGAVDDFSFYSRMLSDEEVASTYRVITTTHELPQIASNFPLWASSSSLPKAGDLTQVANASFHVIKKRAPDSDNCKWTLGVALVWHNGKLFASYGYNQGAENTPTEQAHVRISPDGGKSWGPPTVMDEGAGNLGVSHGVFLSHGGNLWAFMGAFEDNFQRTHTRLYALKESSQENSAVWEKHGVIIQNGFWPMQEPQRMGDGNWIMAGARISNGYAVNGDLPAVAISHGDDFTKWDMIVIPAMPGLGKIWGESTVIVEGSQILNISRYGKRAIALASTSKDYGRTWTPAAPSNLPMATSKPYAGILSDGRRFLVCTTTADTGGKRSPLTIAVSKPGESIFHKVFLVRTSVFDGTPGVSDAKADFSYPYVVEHDKKLYIGYTHKSHAANELAVIPLSSLEE